MNCKELEINVQPGEPFKNDLFGLSSFADMLTGTVDSYSDTGAVITLNGEWGIGKTTFLRMWNQYLIDKQYRTLFSMLGNVIITMIQCWLLLVNYRWSLENLQDFKNL